MAENPPVAEIISWSEQDIFVRCPFCGGSHTNDKYPSKNTRVANCPPVSDLPYQYQISFPFDVASRRVAYWIDKEKKRFVAVGAEPEPELKLEPNQISMLIQAVESHLSIDEPLILLESGTEEITKIDSDAGA